MKAYHWISQAKLLDVLRAAIAREGSPASYARKTRITRAYLSDVLRGRRDPGPAIFLPLGFVREPMKPRPELRYRKSPTSPKAEKNGYAE